MNAHSMSRSRLILALFAVGAGAQIGAALPPPVQGPDVILKRAEPAKPSLARMEFKRVHHDFGPMMDNEIHHTSFEFTNTGSDPLEIINLNADCGCTVPELDKKLYMPGESGVIEVTFDPEGKVGDLNRSITIMSNDSSGANITLMVAAQVTPIVEVVPKVLTVGVTERGRAITRTITVTGRTEDFAVTGVRSRAGDEFSAKILGTETLKNRFGDTVRRSTIEVTFTPDRRLGDYNAQLEMDTNDPRRAIVRAQLIARVNGDLYTKPRAMAMRSVRVGEPVTRKIRLINRTGSPFKVLGVELSEGNLAGEVAFAPADPKNPVEWVLTLTATASVSESRISQELVIRTDAVDEEVVRIPIRGGVRDAG